MDANHTDLVSTWKLLMNDWRRGENGPKKNQAGKEIFVSLLVHT